MCDTSSYFDIKGGSIWEQCQNTILLEKDIIHQGILQFNNKPANFCLTQYHLIRFKKDRLHKSIELLTTQIALFNDNTILLTKNQKQVFLRSTPQNITFWFDQLKAKCIQQSFRQYYDIGELIGQGQFANVYRVTNKRNSQQYALKVFQKIALKNMNLDSASIVKEIKIMRHLKHSGILKIYEVFEDKEFICLVLELMQYSMKSQKKKHTEEQSAQIMLQLFMTLKYIHENKIIHRDIKPDNILYKNQDKICICDFGLADYYNPQSVYQYQRCGTPGYVAPEVLRDQKYDYKVDIYSAGIILYTLLVGKQPFAAHSQNKVIQLNYHGKIDFSQVKCSDLCQQFLQSILSVNSQSRPSAYEVLHHEWFVKTLGEQNYFQLLNADGHSTMNYNPIIQGTFVMQIEIKNFQAIQSMMDEEQDEESGSKILIEFPPQNVQKQQQSMQKTQIQNQNYVFPLSIQSQFQSAIANYQDALNTIQVKQQTRELNYLTEMLQLQHKQMQSTD